MHVLKLPAFLEARLTFHNSGSNNEIVFLAFQRGQSQFSFVSSVFPKLQAQYTICLVSTDMFQYNYTALLLHSA